MAVNSFGPKARRTWGFQACATWRETVANKLMAEGRELDSNRLCFCNVMQRIFENSCANHSSVCGRSVERSTFLCFGDILETPEGLNLCIES